MRSKSKIEKRITALEGKAGINTRDGLVLIYGEDEGDFERQKAEYLKTHPKPHCFLFFDPVDQQM